MALAMGWSGSLQLVTVGLPNQTCSWGNWLLCDNSARLGRVSRDASAAQMAMYRLTGEMHTKARGRGQLCVGDKQCPALAGEG